MGNDMIKILVIVSLSVAFGTAVTRAGSPELHDLSWWCITTPHREPCMDYITKGLQISGRRHHELSYTRSDFRRMLVQSTMDQAMSAWVQVTRFEPEWKHPHIRAAWADCGRLYENTVLQINRTLGALARPGGPQTTLDTDLDVQTWLSAALTNIGTCRQGCADFNTSDCASSIEPNKNLSLMIRNGLAVNAAILSKYNQTEGASTTSGSLPSWVSGQTRRVLAGRPKVDLVVAADGSGHFRTVQEAIDKAARRRDKSRRFVIHVKRGWYKENILVGRGNDNVMLMGDGMKRTVITGDRSVQGGYTMYSSATAGVEGHNFIARDITFRNSAGPSKGQAVALQSSSDHSVFYRCSFHGFQDTILVHSQRQFYRDCHIYGTTDFICGNAAAVFQNCVILARRPPKGHSNVIISQAREDPAQNSGITLHACKILAAKDLQPVVGDVQTYLGRPWMPYSRMTVMKSYIGDLVSPSGWTYWYPGTSYGLNTGYFGEYQNYGPGAKTDRRVTWKAFHLIDSQREASKFTVDGLIGGGSWLHETGVPFTSGL